MSGRPCPSLLRYLLGLEGLALLRGWLEPDERRANERVEEIAALLASREELGTSEDPIGLSPDEGYAAWAGSYDAQPNPLAAVEEPVVIELLADLSPGRALDAACGTGRHTGLLASLGHATVGVDASPEMLAIAARRHPGVETLRGDLRALPLESATVDVALCTLALSHFAELSAPVSELARVLRPGGRLLTSDIHPLLSALGGAALFTREDGRRAYVRETTHSHAAYLDAFAAAGLTVHRCVEPAWTPLTVTMIGKAARRIPEGLEQALVGLPCVVVWLVERPEG